jgi:outer membrane protein TolC
VRRTFFAAGILCLVTAARSSAQDKRPDENKPAEGPPKTPESPAGIVLPDELERVRAELARIESERKRLAGEQATLEVKAKELEQSARGASTNPVLRPRHDVKAISIKDTVERALESNADLLVNFLVANAAQEGPEIQEAPFDPVLSHTTQWADARSPYLSNSPFSGLPTGLTSSVNKGWNFTTTLQKRFATGTTALLEYDDAYNRSNNVFSVNPLFTPKLRATLTQNLLKGFFPNPLDVNGAQIRAAEDDAEGADAEYANQLMDAVVQVEQAYWDVVRAEEDLKVSESSLLSADALLEDERKRKLNGAASDLEVIVAEAGLARGRESVIVNENRLEATRDVLVKLTEPVSDPNRFDLFLVPIERPDLIPSPDVEPDVAVHTALTRRPDYRRAQLQLDSAKQQLVTAENNALPSLDAFAFIEEDGVGRSSYSSWTVAGEGHFYTAGGGVKLSLPLFLRAERAQARQARVNVDRAEAALRALESEVVLEVRKAIRDIRTARARIEAARAARELAAKQLDAVRAQVHFGVALARQVVDSQRDLDDAKSHEIQALIDYRVALTALERAQGTILDPFAEKVPPRVRKQFSGR